jgi:hypothetical protein
LLDPILESHKLSKRRLNEGRGTGVKFLLAVEFEARLYDFLLHLVCLRVAHSYGKVLARFQAVDGGESDFQLDCRSHLSYAELNQAARTLGLERENDGLEGPKC